MAIQRRWRPEDIIFQERPVSYEEYLREKRSEEILEAMRKTFEQKFPNAPAEPSQYLLQFIGGPFNGEQEYLSTKSHSITSGGIFQKVLLDKTEGYSYRYKTTLVPISEVSSFLDDCLLVIAIYQP